MVADGYTTDDILYLWKSQEPVQIAKNLSLPRFSIENYKSSYCNVKTNTGKLKIFECKFHNKENCLLVICNGYFYINSSGMR